jgi:two-component system osmolarity sensor histidine kinase EnvZ
MVLKRYLPKTLFARALLILLTPIVLLQGLFVATIINRHYEAVTRQMAGAVANELNYAVSLIERAQDIDTARAEIAVLSNPIGIEMWLQPGLIAPPDTLRRFYDVTGGAVEETLKSGVRRPMALDLVSLDKQAEARIQTDKGALIAIVDRRRLSASNPHQIFVLIGLSSLLLVAVATIFLRNQVRPIRELAAAAEAFGKGRTVRFTPGGAEEVRRAAAAFLEMRGRIERQIESRTRMLSGVSHDMRTPLTRMKLALAMMEDMPETAELNHDVAEMERMLEAFLAFARDEATETPAEADPVALAQSVAAGARRQGASVAVRADVPDQAPPVALRPGAVSRALQNLVANAAEHGDEVEIAVRLAPRHIEFDVEDDGPGIPPDQRETALKPFTRLDAARNQDRGGGVGLGLSIAAEVARAHGGALILGQSERLGGLRARLRLPR